MTDNKNQIERNLIMKINNPLAITRKALIVNAEEADCYDGVYCLSVDNAAIFQFKVLNCSPAEFAEWYMIKLGRDESDLVEYRVTDDEKHEIWLWVDEHGLDGGEELVITSDEIFECQLNRRIQDADFELSRIAIEKKNAIFGPISSESYGWDIPF